MGLEGTAAVTRRPGLIRASAFGALADTSSPLGSDDPLRRIDVVALPTRDQRREADAGCLQLWLAAQGRSRATGRATRVGLAVGPMRSGEVSSTSASSSSGARSRALPLRLFVALRVVVDALLPCSERTTSTRSGDKRGFLGCLFAYQVLTSAAALRGYGQDVVGSSRRWKSAPDVLQLRCQRNAASRRCASSSRLSWFSRMNR